MASRASRHSLTVIGLAHGVADSIEGSYPAGPPKTVAGHLERIRQRCKQCFELWPDKLNHNELKRINRRMGALEDSVIGADGKGDVVALTSLVLAMLDDLRCVTHGRKRAGVDSLIAAYRQIARYYDRRLDKWHCYDAAVAAVDRMEQMEA